MLIAFFLSFLISLAVCFTVILVFKKLSFVDVPDGVRKIHKGEVSLGGGLALFLSASIVFLVFSEYFLDWPNSVFSQQILNIWYISIIIISLGLIDDLRPLPISLRIIVQILASWFVIIFSDVYLIELGDLLGLGSIYLGELGIPVTIFMVVGLCNAFNMMDGMDGLVTLVGSIAFTGIATLTFLLGITNIVFLISACCLSFLIFNLGLLGQRWKMFLGDSGSMWLGFIVAWYLVAISQGEDKIINPVTALWFVLLPLIDALSTFLSRIWKRKPIFLADRTHIHHILLDSGLKKWKVLLIFLGVSISSTIFGIFSIIYPIKDFYLFYGFLTLWFFYALLIKFPYNKSED